MNPVSPSVSNSETDKLASFGPMTQEKPSFREIFAAEEGPLLRFAYGILGRREVAEDIVQDAFLKLHNHWDEVANPRAWIFRTARNLSLNYIRDHKKEQSGEDEDHSDDGVGPMDKLARMEVVGAVRLLISELPDEDRRLIQLKYDDELKYEEISKATGLSVGNVGYKLYHVLRKLSASLRKMGISGIDG